MTWCIPASSSPPERPGLVLLLDSPEKESLAAMIGTGCEEEGIPIVWDSVPSCEGHPAHAASMRSRLDIGIAVKGETASIGVSNLPGRAWIEMDVHDDRLWRWLGQAAARMVKGQPLPPLPGTKSSSSKRNDPSPPPRENDSPLPDVGLLPMDAPYMEERNGRCNENIDADIDERERFIRDVVRKVLELIRESGEQDD